MIRAERTTTRVRTRLRTASMRHSWIAMMSWPKLKSLKLRKTRCRKIQMRKHLTFFRTVWRKKESTLRILHLTSTMRRLSHQLERTSTSLLTARKLLPKRRSLQSAKLDHQQRKMLEMACQRLSQSKSREHCCVRPHSQSHWLTCPFVNIASLSS